jgi:hypothetical protein
VRKIYLVSIINPGSKSVDVTPPVTSSSSSSSGSGSGGSSTGSGGSGSGRTSTSSTSRRDNFADEEPLRGYTSKFQQSTSELLESSNSVPRIHSENPVKDRLTTIEKTLKIQASGNASTYESFYNLSDNLATADGESIAQLWWAIDRRL